MEATGIHTHADTVLMFYMSPIRTLRKVCFLFSAGCFPKVSDQDLYRSIQSILPWEYDVQGASDCIKKGTVRSLQGGVKVRK